MKKPIITKALVLALTGAFMSSVVLAQGGAPASPAATATGKLKDGATVTISYSSPGVKGRKIWGDLVPYDKVWRAGANKATILEASKEIKVEGKKLPAGKYSLYAIPGEKEWTIILNSATGQWGINMDGSTTEDPAKDVLRVKVKPKKSKEFTERMTYVVGDKQVSLVWENLEVPIEIK
jgi:Protein of unknown function (DUF2911)